MGFQILCNTKLKKTTEIVTCCRCTKDFKLKSLRNPSQMKDPPVVLLFMRIAEVI